MNTNQIEDSYPLSPMQQGMLFHSLYAPESGMYIQQMVSALQERLSVSSFKKAWQEVVARHPILRTSFCFTGLKGFHQEVHRSVTLAFEQQDWRGMSAKQQESRIESYLQADRRRGFEIGSAPLIRFALFQMADADYRFIWSSHHALLDGRSRLLILKDLFALYEAFSRNENLQLERPRSYRDYIDWLGKQDVDRSKEFWKHTLASFTTPTPLMIDRALHSKGSEVHLNGEQECPFSDKLTSSLQAMAQQHGLTLNTLLQGAWAILLSRYSGEDDVVFGATKSCRRSAINNKAQSMVGLCINTLPVRVHVPGDMVVLSCLKELRAQWIAMREHEHTPLVKIQEWSDIAPGKSMFDSLLVFENYQLNSHLRSQGENWRSRSFRLLEQTNYPITVSGYFEPELLLKILYDKARFDDVTIARMQGHLQTLLEAIASNPEQRISQLPLLTDAERYQILVNWNNTGTNYPKESCVHNIFEMQAALTPENVAVVFGKEQLTYDQLNARANQMAHYFRSHGVGPETRVGICTERSLEMIVGLLGILKAGGAYVPMDPAYPLGRLSFMIEDAQVEMLLTQKKLKDRFPGFKGPMIVLDGNQERIDQESSENLGISVSGDQLAYVIYTSGSTGRPKGVAVVHRGIVRLVKETDYVNLSADEVFLQFAPISFDAATFEIWGALLNGARLVIFPSYLPSLQELGKVIKQYGVTTLWLTAGLFHQMVTNHLEGLKPVRQLLAGGDVLSAPLVKKALAELKGCRLINGYGPTENTTFTCCHAMTDPRQVGDTVSIGRPITNTRVYILDDHLQPVPVGVVGELYIGGDGLARGYLNRPELTREKFIANPFSTVPDSRLYKSGDLARYRLDGAIEFLGRKDTQVKIRGFRIELGEIEETLRQHPAVQEVAVLAREDAIGEKHLVAYIVPNCEPAPSVTELRSFLNQKLPEYMVPSAFLTLDALVLTSNGKVDRGALPSPDEMRPDLEETFIAPRSPIEEMLASIWAEVLGLERVGIHDNFFELGGHSLLATQVVSRIRETVQWEIPLRKLFQLPTVADLAADIETIRHEARGIQTPPILRVVREGNLPLSFAQQRLWFLNEFEPLSPVYNISSAWQLSGPLDVMVLEQSVNEIIRRHEVLRTTFLAVDGKSHQVVAPSLREDGDKFLTVPMLDLRNLAEEERESEAMRLVGQEAERPFNLSQDLMLRATVLRLDEEAHILILVIHHIAADGWSIGVFLRELSELYKSYSNGKPSPLAGLAIQYADFAAWQQQWLQGEVLEIQLSYWRRQLSGLPALELPCDRPRPPAQSFRGALQPVIFPKPLVEALNALGRAEGATLFMTLLAGFQLLLHRYTGQADIAVGSPIANRNRAEIEGVIGFFVNTLVLRCDLSNNPTFREMLSRVREVCLQAYAHQDLPFERLVEELQPARDLARHPLFQIMFVLQNTPTRQPLALSGLKATPLPVRHGTAKFDLTLSLVESGEGLEGWFEYNTDLFDAGTIVRMAGHYRKMLEGIVAAPAQKLSDLPILTESERHQLLVEWNDTGANYPIDKCIHELFEAQAERCPDILAVIFKDRKITYKELNEKANQLAHYLMKQGVDADTSVAICVERSIGMIIGIIGILKAGCAYVPLDPEYPMDRLAFIIEDCQASILLSQEPLKAHMPQFSGKIIRLDRDSHTIAKEPVTNPKNKVTPDQGIYIIYTSGSTGKPKGCVNTHMGVSNIMLWIQSRFNLSPDDRVLQNTSISFDVSAWEYFWSLTSGATLVISEALENMDPRRLISLIKKHQITVINLVPTMLSVFLEENNAASCRSLKQFFTGGEELSYSLQQRFFNKFEAELHNLYGPTEAAMFVTHWQCKRSSEDNIVPLGRPLANTTIYILDDYIKPVPIGVAGELHVGGAQIAKGYFNRPELTAERFIPDPFIRSHSARLYKTGDLARYRPDGNIEFLGRRDHQVKIRGFRIELGEIEENLRQHPAVKEVVVVAREDAIGEKHLVAYIVPNCESATSITEFRSFLKQKLPEYMLPKVFVAIEALPLTPNKKVDRRALPAPDQTRPEIEETFVVPRTPVEEMLASIWAEVLGIEQVGIHDNFFELGGHSLLAMRLMSRMSTALNRDVSVKFLFLHPSIAACGEALEDLPPNNEIPRGNEKADDDMISSAWQEAFPMQPFSPFLKIERRPFLPLFSVGKIPPVDSATLGYLHDSLLLSTGLTRNEIINGWYDNLPIWKANLETHWGRIAIILLPRFSSELYYDEDDLIRLILEALEMAGRIGARNVSLGGLLPSATDYGRAVQAAITSRKNLPMISTAHATTAAAVVLAIKKILHEGGREIARERVGFLGLGSIGQTSLRLMLQCLPHPVEITLCDVYKKIDDLKKIQRELSTRYGFRGTVRLLESGPEIPREFYDATLIVGATNVPEILDIRRLKPGAMIVDDSGPHCFVVTDAIRRLREQGDILFTEGGMLRSPQPIDQTRYLSGPEVKTMDKTQIDALSKYNPYQITGCVLSGLLSSCFEDLKPTVGFVDDRTCLQHYERLMQLEFQSADLHNESYVLPKKLIRNFRNRFGGGIHR